MRGPHLLRTAADRVEALGTVARTAAVANGPARWRRVPVAGATGTAGAAATVTLDVRTPLPPLDQSLPPWPGETVDVGGGEVFVRHTPTTAEQGTVPTAVYVHGLGGASTNWTDLAGQLAPFVDGFALDLPGFGRSGPSPTREYTIRAHARVLTTFLEEQVAANGPVHLFGNSMGGAIAIAVAARRPDLVRTLTLISPAVPDLRLRRDDDPRTPLLLLPGVASIAARKIAEIPPKVRARGMIDVCYADPARIPAHRLDEAVAEIAARSDQAWAGPAFVASLKGLVASWFTARPWRDLAAITAPALVLWGDSDRLVSPALAPRVAATLPRAQLLVLGHVGHVAMLEDPRTTARAWLGAFGGGHVTRGGEQRAGRHG